MSVDVSFSPAVLAIVTALLTAMAGALGILWRQTVASQASLNAALQARVDGLQSRLEAVIEDRDAYRDLATEALHYLDAIRSRSRGRLGEDDFEFVPRLKPDHHSLPTRLDEERAEIGTLRMRIRSSGRDLNRLTSLDYQAALKVS